LDKSLQTLVFKGCAIIVCATRPADQFTTVVEAFERCCFEVEWVGKEEEGETDAERNKANLRKAEEIVAKIGSLL